jgi:hypothetical protein
MLCKAGAPARLCKAGAPARATTGIGSYGSRIALALDRAARCQQIACPGRRRRIDSNFRQQSSRRVGKGALRAVPTSRVNGGHAEPCARIRTRRPLCPPYASFQTTNTLSHSRDALRPRFASISRPLQIQRAQGMPDARCTRDLMRNVHKECAHEHTGQRRTSDIPCAMALRLITRSPR